MKQKYLILIVFVLSGCNTGQYQSFQSGVGYQSEQTEDNSYYVTYTGTRTTKTEKVNDFALLRSAELTLEKGYVYFVIIKAENNKDAGNNLSNMSARALTGGSQARVPTAGTGVSAGTPSVAMGPTGPKVKSELTIAMFKEKPRGVSYKADRIVQAIKEEYGMVQ